MTLTGKTGFTPHVIEFLPPGTTTSALNAGYSTIILNKIEEMDKKGDLITAPILEEVLKMGKTTVIKHLKRFEKAGMIEARLAKLQYEHTVVITPVYNMKKKKDATRKKRG